MAETVILVDVQVTSPAGAVSTLRFADRAIAPFPPTDPSRANLAYDDRIIEHPSLRRTLFEDLASLSPSIGAGVMILANADQALDAYQGYTWGEITAWRWRTGTVFAAAYMVLRGVCAHLAYDASADRAARVRVGLYDYRAEASKPVQTVKYLGTNGTDGVRYEGAPDGLKGRPKPLGLGHLLDAHVPAPQVNGGEGVWQLHDGSINGQVAAYDRGADAGYAYDGNYTGSAFDTFAFSGAARFITDHARGLVKINGAPVGQVTFGFLGANDNGYGQKAPGVVAKLLGRAGVPAGRMGTSFAATASARVVGLWIDDETNADELVAEAAAAHPAAVIPDELGVWQFIPFGPPALVPQVTLDVGQVVALQPDDSAPLPAGEIKVGYGRIYQTFSGTELYGGLKGTTAEERLAEEYRWATIEIPEVKARLTGTWRTVEIRTALRSEADALELAAELKALFGLKPDGRPRRMWRAVVELTDEVLTTPLGKTVRLIFPPRGIDEAFLLVGAEPLRPKRDQANWLLWG